MSNRAALVVETACHQQPPHETHWSVRTLAKATGVGRDTVHTILREHRLKPHRTGTFSRLPAGRQGRQAWTRPPPSAVVLCVDEKTRLFRELCGLRGRADPKPIPAPYRRSVEIPDFDCRRLLWHKGHQGSGHKTADAASCSPLGVNPDFGGDLLGAVDGKEAVSVVRPLCPW